MTKQEQELEKIVIDFRASMMSLLANQETSSEEIVQEAEKPFRKIDMQTWEISYKGITRAIPNCTKIEEIEHFEELLKITRVADDGSIGYGLISLYGDMRLQTVFQNIVYDPYGKILVGLKDGLQYGIRMKETQDGKILICEPKGTSALDIDIYDLIAELTDGSFYKIDESTVDYADRDKVLRLVDMMRMRVREAVLSEVKEIAEASKEDVELADCPICGSHARMDNAHDHLNKETMYAVVCSNRDCILRSIRRDEPTEQRAAYNWNNAELFAKK